MNGITYTATQIANMSDLIDTMNRLDPTGLWQLNTTSLTLKGGNLRSTYGAMRLTKVSNGSFGILQPNRTIIPQATLLSVLRGHSTLVFSHLQTGCQDSLLVNAACLTPTHIETTMLKGSIDTVCINTSELMGRRYRIRSILNSTNAFVSFGNVTGTTCINRTALNVGTEYATYVVSDEFGMNDTTYITTHVIENRIVRTPKAFDDYVKTTKAKEIVIDATANDSIYGNQLRLTIITQPLHGKIIITSDNRFIYTPDSTYCNSQYADDFQYSVCDNAGCSTAKVFVTVICDKIKVYNGFSPNNDGVNDALVIEGIESFPNSTLTIYNRWGTQVMTVRNYKNDWKGTWNNENLPDGTYFYFLNNGEGVTTTGYINLQR